MLKRIFKNYQSEQEAKEKKCCKISEDELHIRIRETTQFILYLEKEDENDCEPFTPRTIYPHHKERISDLKSEQKSLLGEQKKVEAELKDVDYRLTQISDIIKIVEQSESTDQVSIPKILMI